MRSMYSLPPKGGDGAGDRGETGETGGRQGETRGRQGETGGDRGRQGRNLEGRAVLGEVDVQLAAQLAPDLQTTSC